MPCSSAWRLTLTLRPPSLQDRHQQRIDRTVAAHADKIAKIEHRVAEADSRRLREAARLKAIADEAARVQAEKDRAAAEKKAKAAEARARYKAKAKEKAREKKEEEDRKRREEDDEERRLAREKLKVRLDLRDGDDEGLEDELADLDAAGALADQPPTDQPRKKKSSSFKPRHSVAGLANLPYPANGDPPAPLGHEDDESDFSDFENFGLDDRRAGKRRKLEHGVSGGGGADDDEVDELATSDDEGSAMMVDQAVPVGLEGSGRKSRATGVGRGNWKRPPKVAEDGSVIPTKKKAKVRPDIVGVPEPQQYQYDAGQAYPPPPASDDYAQHGQYDDPFSALPGHFQNGNGHQGYDYDPTVAGGSSTRGSPQPTGPPMETEAEFAWRIEEARRKVWGVIAKKDIPRVRPCSLLASLAAAPCA